jgi:thiosulfate/3-mercaptopyruvate sulfurtransferase
MKWINRLPVLILIPVVMMAATILSCAENTFKKEIENEKSAVKLVREVLKGNYGIVTTDELKAWMDSGKDMLIVDAMPYSHYKKKHIPGAGQFLFPIPDMTTWDTEQTEGKTRENYESLLGPEKNRTIVLYCGFVKCTRSHNAAIWAKQMGYTDVYRYPGGIYAWEGAKNKVESIK